MINTKNKNKKTFATPPQYSQRIVRRFECDVDLV